jgi:hypothetical protein
LFSPRITSISLIFDTQRISPASWRRCRHRRRRGGSRRGQTAQPSIPVRSASVSPEPRPAPSWLPPNPVQSRPSLREGAKTPDKQLKPLAAAEMTAVPARKRSTDAAPCHLRHFPPPNFRVEAIVSSMRLATSHFSRRSSPFAPRKCVPVPTRRTSRESSRALASRPIDSTSGRKTLAAPHFLRHSLAALGFTCGAGIIGLARIERNSMLAVSIHVAQK